MRLSSAKIKPDRKVIIYAPMNVQDLAKWREKGREGRNNLIASNVEKIKNFRAQDNCRTAKSQSVGYRPHSSAEVQVLVAS